MRNPLVIAIIAIWLLLGWLMRRDYCRCCCGPKDAAIGAVSKDSLKNDTGPIMFNYSSDKAITGEGFAAYKKDLLSMLDKDHILEFNGWYRADEKNSSTFENLGMARAHDARKLFPEVDEKNVRYLSSLIEKAIPDKSQPFASCEIASRLNQENVKEVANKTLIYFPSNSVNKINSKEVEAYLMDVALRVKKSNEKVKLVGNTDNQGEDEANLKLGQRRADVIKSFLVSKGVNAASITASSSGEKSPIASNDTEEDRAKNRRTELEIIK